MDAYLGLRGSLWQAARALSKFSAQFKPVFTHFTVCQLGFRKSTLKPILQKMNPGCSGAVRVAAEDLAAMEPHGYLSLVG